MPHLPATLRRPLAATFILAATGLACAALPFTFVHHGNFQTMMKSGDTAGKVALSSLPQAAGTWGVGATAGLKGEIVQVDGKLLVSPGSNAQGRVRPPHEGEQAVLFASGRVNAWRDVPVPSDMDAAAFEAFVRREAVAAGLDAAQPFVFRVEGAFPHLVWHVVTGETRTAGDGTHGGRHAKAIHTPPAAVAGTSSHSGGHANEHAAMRVFHQPGARGQLVGVYSGVALEGVVSHPGERLHVHYVDPETSVSGHVDRYAVGRGSVLKLPAGN